MESVHVTKQVGTSKFFRMASFGGQIRRYSREELLLMQKSPSCLIPPALPDCVPLQKRKGLEEGKERRKEPQIQDRGGYKQSTDHKPHKLLTRPRQPHGRNTGEEASLGTTVDARELTRREGCREEQTASIRPRKRPFDADYFLGLEDDTELTIKLCKNIEQFEVHLKSDFISVSDVHKLVKILHKVLACELQRESVLKILQVVCSSRFLDKHLQTYIEHLQKLSKIFQQNKITKPVEKVLDLLSNICHRLPSERSKVYLILNYIKSQNNLETVLFNSPAAAKQFEEVLAQSQKLFTTQRKATGARNKGIEDMDDEIPSEDFVDLPVFPDKQDLDDSKMPFLRPSKTVGAFKDAHHYLDVHFRLLREDFLRPLRNGITALKAIDRNDLRFINMDVRLYQNVQIIGIVPGNTLDYIIQFDVRPFRKVRWQSSKRLIFGSLVCLSDDNFDTVFFAVITKREDEKIENGIIHVCFETQTGEVLGLSNSRLFTMVESVSFFEASRHVLEGLKQMRDMVPMSRYIVECQQKVNPPSYLSGQEKQVTMNLTALTGTTRYVNVERVPVIDFDAWPDIDWKLNQSQLKAVKMALTNELAIIQGPPGTGKTYVGLKIVQVLLENARVWNPDSSTRPILIVCYTNHALDQFLEGMLKFCPDDIVRVGSRSQSKALSPFNISEMKKRLKESGNTTARLISSRLYECHERRKELARDITHTKAVLDENLSRIFKAKDLKSSIPPQQYKSLTSKSTDMGLSLMSVWLCGGMIIKNENDFPETDPYDQLARKVTSQILRGEADFDQDVIPADICSEDFPVRAQMYRLWVKKTKQRLLLEVQKSKKARINPKALEEWLEAAEVEILPDHILQPDIDKSLFEAITCREGLPRDIYAPYFIRLWLGIDENDRNCDDLEIVLNELLESQQGDTSDYCEVSETSYGQQITDSLPDDLRWQPVLPTVHTGKNGTPERETEIREIKDGAKKLNIDEEAEILQKQRLLDDDEDDEVAPQMFGIKESAEGTSEPSDTKVSEWKVVSRQKGRNFRKIFHLVETLNPMSEEEAAMITDVWDVSLDVTARVRLYLSWLQKYRKHLTRTIATLADSYAAVSRMLSELNLERDGLILKRAKVIGMTTTGAAKYHRLLATVGCPIVIMEEAAEVLEAHVVTTLSSSCQHLILIGDHQQLRPSPTVYELSKFYNLDISLFERLIKNQLHHTTLTLQHRMKPEIANFLRHVYPDLKDHETTSNRKPIRGVKQDVYLLHHEFGETITTETSSKLNDHEADFCLCLCRYLLQQGYRTSQITILTAYSGQVFALKSRMKKEAEFFKRVRVTAVDNYQGEENDIIILSLVRSNEEGNVGFLGTDNRVCVALSRARDGLYAIGNFKILAEKSELWKNIVRTAKSNQQLGDCLVLRCENHRTIETKVSKKDDFQHVPEGGCKRPCTFRLNCGHVCERLCHGYDTDHKYYQCMKKCGRPVCAEGHLCLKKCYEPCGKCIQGVEKVIPMCGHKAMVECHRDPHTWRCTSRCEGNLEKCGHQCSGKCGQCRETRSHVGQCTQEVERVWPCGHLIKSPCHASPATWPCPQLCGVILDCGHRCKGTCGECLGGLVHKACEEVCGKILSGCSHKCRLPCGSKCLPCKEKPCLTRCKHSRCPLVCGEPCKPCEERCPWKCEHVTCQSFCHTPCQPCGKKCLKILKCGHLCSGFCGEMCLCYTCEKEQFIALAVQGLLSKEECVQVHDTTILVKLPECKHIFRADALDAYVQRKRFTPGTFLVCPGCAKPLKDWECWRYHSILRRRRQDEDKKKTILKDSTLVSKVRQYKIIKSMDMLTSSKQDPRSFAYIALRRNLETADLDVNKCFALTNQIKLARMIEMVDQLFLQIRNIRNLERNSISDLQDDIESLKRLVLPPVDNMSEQRRQELTSETRRLVYTMLLTSLKGIPSYYLLNSTNTMSSLQKQADQLLKTLKTKKKEIIPMAECERVIEEAREKNSTYQLETACVDLSILGASPEVDLCDIGKVSGQLLSSRIRALQLIRMHIDD